MAYLLPGEFILKRAEEQWKGGGSLMLLREVTRPGAAVPVPEQVTLKAGKVQVSLEGRTWSWPEETGASTADHRPGVIDGLFLQPAGGLARLAAALRIEVDTVSLDRLPTPGESLPFRPLFRLGGEKATAPHLDIEKDRWYVRAVLFRESAEGPLWRAEYDRQGLLKDLPAWLPARIQVYRSGELYESITVARRVGAQKESSGASPRKAQSDDR